MNNIKRIGSKSIKDIPEDILIQLNQGEIETANLVEWLAIDQLKLLHYFLTSIDKPHYFSIIQSTIQNLKKRSFNLHNQIIGEYLLKQSCKYKNNQENDTSELIHIMINHPADLIRCWAAYMIAFQQHYTLHTKFEQMKFLADDNHFSVREVSWMALRATIIQEIDASIAILNTWSLSTSENIRRFASEATRPRGVWCAHIFMLKQQPDLALSILQPLKSDISKYVQDSVGNWLNDAGKSQPKFVTELCHTWQKQSDTKETAYIIKKALRNIRLERFTNTKEG
jgi:3-methyladenine DNA glycosylase AlkC